MIDARGTELRVGQLVVVLDQIYVEPVRKLNDAQTDMVGQRYMIESLAPGRDLVFFEGPDHGIPPCYLKVVHVGLRGLAERYATNS